MKAVLLSDEISVIHWSMLKSVLLIIALLPASHFLFELWQNTEGSSQIIVGFVAISVFSALSIVGFVFALLASTLKLQQNSFFSIFERRLLLAYRYVPMMFMLVIMSYLATQI